MQMDLSKVLSLSAFSTVEKGSWLFIPACCSLFHSVCLSLSFTALLPRPSALSPSYLDVSFHFTPTPHSPVSPWAFILPGCFLHKNTPIGRQAPLSDTIHCTRIDIKSVLTSTTEFLPHGGNCMLMAMQIL